ncbi:hypothetical protein CDO29_27990 (plasmid) [Sinorhizobium meliloti]|nr:hypothetical protein CDO29_27990 [Sinorhizobium meliloti]
MLNLTIVSHGRNRPARGNRKKFLLWIDKFVEAKGLEMSGFGVVLRHENPMAVLKLPLLLHRGHQPNRH